MQSLWYLVTRLHVMQVRSLMAAPGCCLFTHQTNCLPLSLSTHSSNSQSWQEAAWGLCSDGASETVSYDLTRFKSNYVVFSMPSPQSVIAVIDLFLMRCTHVPWKKCFCWGLGPHNYSKQHRLTHIVWTCCFAYSVWKKRAECDIWQRPTSQKHFSLSASSVAAGGVWD